MCEECLSQKKKYRLNGYEKYKIWPINSKRDNHLIKLNRLLGVYLWLNEKKNILIKILKTTDSSYTYEYSYLGNSKKLKAEAIRIK